MNIHEQALISLRRMHAGLTRAQSREQRESLDRALSEWAGKAVESSKAAGVAEAFRRDRMEYFRRKCQLLERHANRMAKALEPMSGRVGQPAPRLGHFVEARLARDSYLTERWPEPIKEYMSDV